MAKWTCRCGNGYEDPMRQCEDCEQIDRRLNNRIERLTRANECRCGSGEQAYWLFDAQGIELCKGCSNCEREKLRGYRPEILTGYDQSDVDEPIEAEEW